MLEENLLFIISLPRSGSTYLQGLLSNNSLVNTCSEPWILLNYANQIKPSSIQGDFDNKLAIDAFCDYKEKFPDFNFRALQKNYLLSLYSPLLKDHSYVIDKTPRYWEILNEIRELFPGSKIIVLKRNPVHVAESIFKTWRADTFDKILKFQRDLLEGPFAIRDFEKNHADTVSIYFLTYEALVDNTETEVEKLYNWLGIPFKNEVLEIKNNRKFKGKYGDPFLNSGEEYAVAKKKSDSINLNKVQRKFLLGYANYLGEDFMKEYGDYQLSQEKVKKTMIFSHYRYRSGYNKSQISENKIKYILKDKIYSILENIL